MPVCSKSILEGFYYLELKLHNHNISPLLTRISNITPGPIISHVTNISEIISNPALIYRLSFNVAILLTDVVVYSSNVDTMYIVTSSVSAHKNDTCQTSNLLNYLRTHLHL
jgi:hypothetical protein